MVYFSLLVPIICKKYERSELMAKNQPPNNPNSNSNTKQSKTGENEKRMNQVPNSKNPKVPGNQTPYR
jgi:hypothetical protein